MDMRSVLDKLRELEANGVSVGDAIKNVAAMNGGLMEAKKDSKKADGKKVDKENGLKRDKDGKITDRKDASNKWKSTANEGKKKDDKKKKVDEAIAINADGEEATELMHMLKLAGVAHGVAGSHNVGDPEAGVPGLAADAAADAEPGMGNDMDSMAGEIETMADEPEEMGVGEDDHIGKASTTPSPRTMDMKAAIPSGNDMHKEKSQPNPSAFNRDNPMAEMEQRLMDKFRQMMLDEGQILEAKKDDKKKDDKKKAEEKARDKKAKVKDKK